MIRLGYIKSGEDIVHETVDSVPESNEAMDALRELKRNDSIDYFYKERQTTETEWEKYAYVDPLQIDPTSSIILRKDAEV